MESLCGSFKVRLKSGDGSLFLLFSPFTALRRRLRAAVSGGCEELGLRFIFLAILRDGGVKGLHPL